MKGDITICLKYNVCIISPLLKNNKDKVFIKIVILFLQLAYSFASQEYRIVK